MKSATAYANANIALVKYWGKSEHHHNIPAVSSVSMTLDGFGTRVALAPKTGDHSLSIDGQVILGPELTRLATFLERVREVYPYNGYWSVITESTIPMAAGLASSASFFASLATALDDGLSLHLSPASRSCLARLGSASAARSIFAGFAGLHGGVIPSEKAVAFPIASTLDVVMLLALVERGQKPLSSREAMNHTQKTSPFYESFVNDHEGDFLKAQAALAHNNFVGLGEIMEHSTLKMHASMWAAKPAVNYLQPASLLLMNCVRTLRQNHGPIAYFTLDAGPNVKVLCQRKDHELVKNALSAITSEVLCSSLGCGAHLL